ncbi:MAG: heparinase II/III family protein, partial [Kiloniellales bacterium]|nr:heparinase II/III family protein [Kiloniellales bacterium]
KWDADAWSPDLIGRRLANWLGQFEFFAASAEIEFRRDLIQSIDRQAFHLAHVLPAGLYGSTMISTLKGLIFAGVALPGADGLREKGLVMLGREISRQLLPDGGHIERSPATQLSVLRDLMDIRAALTAADAPNPDFLEKAISVMAPVLRLLQHGDGKLALFNGTNEGDSLHIDLVLQRSPGPKRPLMSAPDSGFQRLQSARSVVIADVGQPPPSAYDHEAHAGTGSFEFSVGRERIIVNCGAQIGPPELRMAQRSTAAHSTLVLGDRNSTPINEDGGFATRPGKIFNRRVEDEDGNHLLELTFDGYYSRLGALHHRSVYLSASGTDLRGEDRLEYPEGGGEGQSFAIRFHLHPDVKTVISQGSTAVFISTKKAGGWRLRSTGAKLALESSIYLGEPANMRRSQQIVLYGKAINSQALVKWALRKENKSQAP